MQLSAVDANLLVMLHPLLQTRSVTLAAKRLGLSPSATSHALARLRVLLGDELLVRAGRSLVLTRRGAALAPLVAEAVTALEQVLQPAQEFLPEQLRRTFQLHYAEYWDWLLLPKLDASLRAQAPGVDVHTHTKGTVAQLRNGSIDLVLTVAVKLPPETYTRPFVRDRFVSIVRVGHPCLKRPMTLARFADLRHILVAPRGTAGGVVDTMLEEHGLKRRVVRTIGSFLAAPHLVAQSDYVLTLPASVAHVASSFVNFETIDVPVTPPPSQVYMVWHQRNHKDPAHRWFRELVAGLGASLVPTPDSPSA